MKKTLFALSLLVYSVHLFAQTLNPTRATDWTLAGIKDSSTLNFEIIQLTDFGIVGDNTTPNDAAIQAALQSSGSFGKILVFPSGQFRFENSLHVPNNTVFRGAGAEFTQLTLDLGGSGNGFNISGSLGMDSSLVTNDLSKDDFNIPVFDASKFEVGDWIKIMENDSARITSSWAFHSTGQIAQIESISGLTLHLKSPLRREYSLAKKVFIQQLIPAQNVGFECLKIARLDDTAPEQSAPISFSYAVNCWINGIESDNCTFSHVKVENSSNLEIVKSYFHHAFDYGENGRGYGVMLQQSTNECRIENSIFEHLRHSMIIQSGGNGNVFAYNYSIDPFWTSSSTPCNSAGDIVLHGNYTYLNLFEQNICQNIVIDYSHGPNGPFNTFFRNRAESYGIFFSAANSPNQNFLGNEIPNTGFPYSLANYTIQGTGHFLFGNNNKGTIVPSGTENLPEKSFAYASKPDFVLAAQWGGIGTPSSMQENDNEAKRRFHLNNLFVNSCGKSDLGITSNQQMHQFSIYPNPCHSFFTLTAEQEMKSLRIFDLHGKQLLTQILVSFKQEVKLSTLETGVYLLEIEFKNGEKETKRIQHEKK